MKKIVFISNTASLTGAPYVLLLFIKWLKATHKTLIIDIVFLEGGYLASDFIEFTDKIYKYSDVTVKKALLPKLYSYAKRKALGKGSRKQVFIDSIANQDYDIIYANTIASVRLAVDIKKSSTNSPELVAHIHELNITIKEYLHNFDKYIPQIDRFISVSNVVMQNLNLNWNIDPLRNHLVYAFSDKIINKFKSDSTSIDNDKVLQIGAAGHVNSRKGSDLFIQVAVYIKNYYPDLKIQFTWVGYISYLQRLSVEADLEKAGLQEVVIFVGEQVEPEIYFEKFDVFLMTSREDPFPLVCIEVGKMGVPIICFEKATGTAEIITNGGGFVVPYLDCAAMAEKVIAYHNDDILRKKDSDLNKVNFSKYTSEVMAKEIYRLLI
jgi:glycosyltransferase involved in cell wall biosynthesis